MGKPKKRWTPEEESALIAGVRKHGMGKWRDILSDGKISESLKDRSNVDLKDKWRNLCANNVGVLPPDAEPDPKLHNASTYEAGVSCAADKDVVARNLSYDTGEAYKEVERLEKMDQMAEESCKKCLSYADWMVLCWIEGLFCNVIYGSTMFVRNFRKLGASYSP